MIVLDPRMSAKDGSIILNCLHQQEDFKDIFVASLGEYDASNWLPQNIDILELDPNNLDAFFADSLKLLDGKLNNQAA